MIVTLWAIWSARWKLIHEGIYQTPYATHYFITSYISDVHFLNKPASNAAVSRAGGFGEVAAICRDLSGAYLGASAVVFRNIDVAEVLETSAIREALALSEDLYLHKIAIVSDCQVAVDAIKVGTSASYGLIVHEIIERSRVFSSCIISHEFRTSNFEAHKLAKHALTLGTGRHAWLGQPRELLFVPVNIVTIE
ncbi:hypothetical protein VPH35_028823 [Triticum aestivum]